MTILIKVAGRRIPLVEILTIRQFVMQALITPFSIADFPAVLRTNRPGMQIIRGLLQLGAMCLTFAAVIQLPLALSTTISFSYALFVTIGAGTILKERVGAARWIATAIGLAGVVIMLRPTGDGASLFYSLIAILGAVFAAASAVSLRLVPGAERADTILTYQALVLLAALAIPTALAWVTPTFDELIVLLLVGVSGTVGQWLLTVAYKTGEAAALAPLDFVRLILTVICGLVFFGESLDSWELAGAAVLIGATAYTFRANARDRSRCLQPRTKRQADDLLRGGHGRRNSYRLPWSALKLAGEQMTGSQMTLVADRHKSRLFQTTDRPGVRAPCVEAAAGGRIDRAGRITLEDDLIGNAAPAFEKRRGEERLRVRVLGRLEDAGAIAHFHHLPGVHDQDAIGHVLGDAQVMGDEQIGHSRVALQLLEEVQHARLCGKVERRDRFIEHQELGIDGDRPRDPDALSLTAA